MTISIGGGASGGEPKSDGVIGAGSAAFRKVMGRSLTRGKAKTSENADFSYEALSDVLAQDQVNTVIESEIIPRLLMAHSGADRPVELAANASPEAQELSVKTSIQAADFAALPLQMEAANLLEHIDAHLEDGVSFETICVDVLAPSARALGEMWCQDECDFVDVTMGLWRLQEVMRELSSRVPPAQSRSVIPGTALFAPMPGDVHAFGAQMIEEIFAKAGWLSEVIVKPQRRELLDRLSRKPFDILGLTITRECPATAISSLIKTIRGVSANPNIAVLVGGNMVNANPAIAGEVGADGTASDACGALKLAETLVEAAPCKALTLR